VIFLKDLAMSDLSQQWRKRSIEHLWNPYTEMSEFAELEFPIMQKASGAYLYDLDGKAYLDGIASWWCVNLGHSHPRLIEAVNTQMSHMQHSILGGMSHPPAIELAERLAALAPGNLNHVYYAGDGSSAVEAALKIAVQYYVNMGAEPRSQFISLADGYHGDTLGAVGVGYVDSFHKDFKEVIRSSHRALSPDCANCPFQKSPDSCQTECFQSMEDLVVKHHQTTAAVIVEPRCQGAAGIRIYPALYLKKLRTLCDDYNLLLICDEIAVGFGRTGEMFACETASIVPDIMTIGKGLTGGYMPMSALITTPEIYNSFKKDNQRVRTFFHGHTFCGNPVTSALALAALDVYHHEQILQIQKPRALQLERGFQKLGGLLHNSMALSLGMVAKVEINQSAGGAARAHKISRRALTLGLIARPMGAAIYLWPPLNISELELKQMLEIFEQAIRETEAG
jgi:adenosylmethionine-8-amino-7-oxononanoate aminotransferase